LPAPAIGAAVCGAFSLGWQMARLYESPKVSKSELEPEDDLPGLSALSANWLTGLGLDQVDEALRALGTFLGTEALLPTTQKARDATTAEHPDEKVIREAILTLHAELLVKLTAADFRLGKSYGLGRALADTCAPARGTPDQRLQTLERRLEPHRALVVVGWLDDLRTLLPEHAGHAVTDSLERWIGWAKQADLGQMKEEEINATTHQLHRQGQRWRAILSGEKACKDLLSIGNYITAGQGMLRRAGQIVLSFAGRLWLPLILAGILVGGGIALMILDNSTSQVLAGLGTVAAGLGITWKSATSSLGNVSLRLGEPLWGAEVDSVVANCVTSLPGADLGQAGAGAARPDTPAGEAGKGNEGRNETPVRKTIEVGEDGEGQRGTVVRQGNGSSMSSFDVP
jgi:hypothetical protein